MGGQQYRASNKWSGILIVILLVIYLGFKLESYGILSDIIRMEIFSILLGNISSIIMLLGGFVLLKVSNLHKKWGYLVIITQLLLIICSIATHYMYRFFSYSDPIYIVFSWVYNVLFIVSAFTFLLLFKHLKANWSSVDNGTDPNFDDRYNY